MASIFLGQDTIAVLKALEEIERRVNCVIAPPMWYGPASFAVLDQKEEQLMLIVTGLKACFIFCEVC